MIIQLNDLYYQCNVVKFMVRNDDVTCYELNKVVKEIETISQNIYYKGQTIFEWSLNF